jgi:membrane protein DedA with SNARE-associated domain
MRKFWTVLAVLLGALAVGGVATLVEQVERGDGSATAGDVLVAFVLALAAWWSWRRRAL